jgi:hypothetical protein
MLSQTDDLARAATIAAFTTVFNVGRIGRGITRMTVCTWSFS